MGAYAVSVEKEISFRNVTERFANVYHYHLEVPLPLDYENLADAVVARDRAAYPSAVAFKFVRVWGPTEGSEADNKMRFEEVLNVNGLRTATSVAIYPELCVVTSLFVGRSPVHNRKLFLRKYIRYIRAMAGGETSDQATLDTSTRNFYTTWMEGNRSVSSGGLTAQACTHRDVLAPQASEVKTLQFMHIRQMKQ